MFNNILQQDAAEFLQSLIELCDPLKDLCKFDILETFKCKNEKCNNVYSTKKSDPTTMLHLFPKGKKFNGNSITEILKNYDNKTTLSKKCSKCNIDTLHDQTESFESLPEVLFLIADRFTYVGTCNCPNRICTGNCDFRTFKIPDPILPSEQINYNSEKLSANYKLTGILTHHGNSVDAGHYVTDISVHQGWKNCNDQRVTNISLPSKFGYIFQYQLDQFPQMEPNISTTNNTTN